MGGCPRLLSSTLASQEHFNYAKAFHDACGFFFGNPPRKQKRAVDSSFQGGALVEPLLLALLPTNLLVEP